MEIWSEKSWKKFQVISSVQGEASTGWSLHQAWYQQYLVPGATVVRPTLSFPVAPLPGVSRGRDTSSTGQVLQSSSQWELITLNHVWEGRTLCLDQRHATFYMGFAKLDFISLPQPLP